MFTTPDQVIKSIQDAKRTFVNTFVFNDTVKQSLHAYIDTQEQYTKELTKNTFDITTAVVKVTPFAIPASK
jgi:phage regulator Rha-like protein